MIKRLVTLSVFFVLMALPLFVWLAAEGNPLEYLVYEVPPGQTFYIFSKLAGLYTFFLLWLHIMWVLLKRTKLRQFLPQWQTKYHQTGALSVSVVAAIHITLFVIAVSLRKESFAYTLLLPNFSDYYHSLVTLGVVAFWLLPIILYTGAKRKSTNAMRWLHYLAYLFFILVFFHSLGVGSETKVSIMFWFYIGIGISTLFAVIYRFFLRNPTQFKSMPAR